MAPQPKLAVLLCENSGAVVEWLMDKFNLDVSLVARLGGHSAPRSYRDPHLCFDSDGEEDCRKVRQGENDHPSTGDGVDHEWWCLMNVWNSARRNGDEDEDVFVFLLTGATSLCGGEIVGILTVLFRFFGYGLRLAMCSVNWTESREFAILVPDPIAFAPWPGEPL